MNIRKSIFIALMFLSLMSLKAWGYADQELPSPSFFSNDTFFSNNTFSSSNNFSFSHAVLTDEKGVAICQVNLQENPEFLPQFAEPSSNALKPLDLPECEEESLHIVAQYAQQAWIKKEVAIAPAVGAGVALASGCIMGSILWAGLSYKDEHDIRNKLKLPYSILAPTIMGGLMGGIGSGPGYIVANLIELEFAKQIIAGHAGLGAIGGLACYNIMSGIFYIRSSNFQDQENQWPDMP